MGGKEGITSMNSEEELKANKEGYPIGDFSHMSTLNVDTIGHRTHLGMQLAAARNTGDNFVVIDTEDSMVASKKAMEGVVFINSDDSTIRMTDALREAAKNGAKMVVVDSHSALPQVPENPTCTFQKDKAFEKQDDLQKQGKSKHKTSAVAMSLLGSMWGVPSTFRVDREKTLRKCLLPGCEVMHSHNGGYCKADHCREHQRILREKK